MSLVISDTLLGQIRTAAMDHYPHECCGLLLGHSQDRFKHAKALRPERNMRDDSPHTSYRISPSALFDAEKYVQSRGMDIIGVYHSHPDHPAQPSESDLENAVPWYSYIIIRVRHGVPADLTCWTLREDRSAFEFEELRRETCTCGQGGPSGEA